MSSTTPVEEKKPQNVSCLRKQITADDLGCEMVDIFVGSSRKQFKIHKRLLCDTAEYFDKMFNSGSAEAITSTAELPTDDEGAFALFVGWLYSGALEEPFLNMVTLVEKRNHLASRSLALVRLYAMCEVFSITTLLDITMSRIIKLHQDCCRAPNPSQYHVVYHHTKEGSKLRLCYLDYFKHSWLNMGRGRVGPDNAFVEVLQKNSELLIDLIITMQGNGLSIAARSLCPSITTKCKYHMHTEQGPCSDTIAIAESDNRSPLKDESIISPASKRQRS